MSLRQLLRFSSARSLLSALAFPFALAAWGGLSPAVHAQHPTPVTSILNGESTPDTTLEVNHNSSLLAPGTLIDDGTENDSIPAEGPGTRMMWYPAKAAFRAGRVGIQKDGTQWDADKVGRYSVAFGADTRANGRSATAMGSRTSASGIRTTAMGLATTAIGRQAVAVGLGTIADNGSSLSMGACNSSNTSGDNSLFVAGNGSFGALSCDSRSDALVLKKDGDLAVGPSDPLDLRLYVQKDKPNAGVGDSPKANMVLFENTNTGDRPDVMGLQAGPTSPGSGVTYLSFYNRSGTTLGQIQGDGSGGVSYVSSSADFAEELPVAGGTKVPEAAHLVGVRGGNVSLKTDGVDRVMIVSEAPAMTGNATPSSEAEGTNADDERRVPVAFVGQVPAKVRGPAHIGDLIVPSGRNDGTARAVAPGDYRRSEHGPIAGQAWSEKSTEEIGKVTVAVGLGRSGAVAKRMEDHRERIAELEAENKQIRERLSDLEAKVSSGPALAALGGSSARLLLAFLMGGLLGAGLLWRRRG